MQKLLRRSCCSAPGPILSPTALAPALLKPFTSTTTITYSPLSMPTSAAVFVNGSGITPFLKKPQVSSRGVCQCSGGNVSIPRRAWAMAVPKSAWFSMKSEGDGDVSVSAKRAVEVFSVKEEEEGGEEGGEEEKKVKVQRRTRASTFRASESDIGNPDLLTIPGVGPRNLRKLVDNGIREVAELKQLYKNKFFGKSSEKMVDYLKSSVGIKHKNHAESITLFLKENVDKDDTSDSKPLPKKRLTFCVEGNISVGKTTFLKRIADETMELQGLVDVVPEPVSKWQSVGKDNKNLLDAFYAEPERYAYTFQNYVFVTRVMQERDTAAGNRPLRLMERSVFSDRMVFVRAVHEAKYMSDMEISIYDSWFDPVVSNLPDLVPDAFIYLRASPDTCHKRMLLRKREEECAVTLDYLRGIHDKHESWFKHDVLSKSDLPLHLDSSLHPEIKDRVFYLQGENMHPCIQKVPTLILDCEPDIDFSKDIDAKRQYAGQVAKFFEFVKKRNADTLDALPVPQLRVPLQPSMFPNSGLYVPGGPPFPGIPLNSMNFSRAMSTYAST